MNSLAASLDSSIVYVPENDLEIYRKRLDKLNKKAATFGLDPIISESSGLKQFYVLYESLGREGEYVAKSLIPVKRGKKPPISAPLVNLHAFKLTYPIVKLGDWTVIGVIEPLSSDGPGDNENLVLNVTGQEDDSAALNNYRSCKIQCEHCNTNRKRNKSFILRSANNDIKQVGNSCLEDFTGIDPAQALFLAKMTDTYKTFDDFDPDGYLESGGGANVIGTRAYLAACNYSIERYGFYGAKAASDMSVPTYLDALNILIKGQDKRFFSEIDKHLKAADQIIDINAREYIENSSDFAHNLRAIISKDDIKIDGVHIKIAAGGAYGCRLRLMQAEEKTKPGRHIGTPKDRIDLRLTLKGQTSFSTFYGLQFRFNFKDEEGNALTWKTGAAPEELIDTPPGLIVDAKFTIKEHKTFRDTPSTEITRLKIIRVVEQELDQECEENDNAVEGGGGYVMKGNDGSGILTGHGEIATHQSTYAEEDEPGLIVDDADNYKPENLSDIDMTNISFEQRGLFDELDQGPRR